MLEKLQYKNHLNEVFEFGTNGIYVNENALHDYKWTVTKKNNRIAALDYSIVNRKLPVVIFCDSEAEGIAAKNRLLEVAEKDVLAMKHGRIIIGNYYFRCFITESTKKEYLVNKRYLKLTLTLTSDFPYWVKESTYSFRAAGEAGTTGGQGLDFNFDYPVDYTSGLSNSALNNTGFVASNFKLIIYGVCNNPEIHIGGHTYQVNCSVGANEYLIVDSIAKTITLVGSNGTATNKFKDRNRNSYIFEKIPAGHNAVTWDGEFGFDIILMEERSEPKWT